jgi:hypothetical protein
VLRSRSAEAGLPRVADFRREMRSEVHLIQDERASTSPSKLMLLGSQLLATADVSSYMFHVKQLECPVPHGLT